MFDGVLAGAVGLCGRGLAVPLGGAPWSSYEPLLKPAPLPRRCRGGACEFHEDCVDEKPVRGVIPSSVEAGVNCICPSVSSSKLFSCPRRFGII